MLTSEKLNPHTDQERDKPETVLRYVESHCHAATEKMSSQELRTAYLMENLFLDDVISLSYREIDRTVVGAATPTEKDLYLETIPELASDFFGQRRETGIVNIGGSGVVSVEDKMYTLEKHDCLYIGRGQRDVIFSSKDAATPARFYFISYPAHTVYPTRKVTFEEVSPEALGSAEKSNERTLYKCIHPLTVESCQLVMGVTMIREGSAWNTMPPHTHLRRSEVYLYFDLAPETVVFHLMGRPQATRHLIVREGEAVFSPPWSIHTGAGTGAYSFVWTMGGENQDFTDMDQVRLQDLV